MTAYKDFTREQLIKEIEKQGKHIIELENQLRETMERAESINQLKAMFLANISHEIRTPMNGIIGMYNVLKQTELTEEQKEFLDIINISGQNLLSIIDDIIDLSKIESGQLILESQQFSLGDIIQDVLNLLTIKARGKGIELKTQITDTVFDALIGDAARLKQIITNLTNNAIKYTKEGSVTIQVEPTHQDQKTSKLKFSIIDTGIGISPEGKEKLFKAFSQIDSSSTRKYGGTGLGLAIAKNLSNLMHGDIGVESEIDKGSTFWFTATLKVAKDKNQEVTNIKIREQQEPDKLKILLVEDNLLNQKFAVATLQREGHLVDIAENGKIAVDLYRKNVYDLILMDIQMPVMDGITATKEIRKIEKEKGIKNEVKIIAVTANVSKEDKKECLKIGMSGYIIKPFNTEDLDLALKTT